MKKLISITLFILAGFSLAAVLFFAIRQAQASHEMRDLTPMMFSLISSF